MSDESDDIYKTPESVVADNSESDGYYLEKPRDLEFVDWLFSFKGRLNRKQFWMFYLPYMAFLLFSGPVISEEARLVIAILLLWPALAVQTKRWHDIEKSGMWCIAWFIPIVGWLIVLINAGFGRGSKIRNTYGRSLYKDT